MRNNAMRTAAGKEKNVNELDSLPYGTKWGGKRGDLIRAHLHYSFYNSSSDARFGTLSFPGEI